MGVTCLEGMLSRGPGALGKFTGSSVRRWYRRHFFQAEQLLIWIIAGFNTAEKRGYCRAIHSRWRYPATEYCLQYRQFSSWTK